MEPAIAHVVAGKQIDQGLECFFCGCFRAEIDPWWSDQVRAGGGGRDADARFREAVTMFERAFAGQMCSRMIGQALYDEVRKLAERSLKSSDSIRQIIGGVQNEANATIMATEQGARQAREVGELMGTTATMLDQSILATQQQRSAADQVAEAMIQIREAAGQLAADQTQREDTSERVEQLVGELDATLARFGVSRTRRDA